MVALLDLRNGEMMLDSQSEADLLLRFAHDRTGTFGRAVGMCFGQDTVNAVGEQTRRWDTEGIEMMIGHPSQPIALPENSCSGVILRHTNRLLNLEPVFFNLIRVTKSNGRVLARHTNWEVKLPKATQQEEELLAALNSPGCTDGKNFFNQFANIDYGRSWRDVRYDVYTVASRDARASRRYDYDWRTMMRDQLGKSRIFSPRQMLDLIERLQNTRGARVTADRYLALGIKR